jgi:hypothetical protein
LSGPANQRSRYRRRKNFWEVAAVAAIAIQWHADPEAQPTSATKAVVHYLVARVDLSLDAQPASGITSEQTTMNFADETPTRGRWSCGSGCKLLI